MFEVVIIPKHDTFEKWMSYNPRLKEHELAIVKFKDEVIKYKIGDGITHFRDLPFVSLKKIKFFRCYDKNNRYATVMINGGNNW